MNQRARKQTQQTPGLYADHHLRILSLIRLIPPGRVCTYGRIAEAAGLPGRARLVGRILRDSPLADGVPWHRVVGAAGRISPRPGPGADEQRNRLLREGIAIDLANRVDLDIHLCCP